MLGFLPVGSGLQLESRDEELFYWGSVAELHTWNKHKDSHSHDAQRKKVFNY